MKKLLSITFLIQQKEKSHDFSFCLHVLTQAVVFLVLHGLKVHTTPNRALFKVILGTVLDTSWTLMYTIGSRFVAADQDLQRRWNLSVRSFLSKQHLVRAVPVDLLPTSVGTTTAQLQQ